MWSLFNFGGDWTPVLPPARALHRASLLVQTRAKLFAHFVPKTKKTPQCGAFLILGAIGLEPTKTEVGGFTVSRNPT